ncbi:hypothetical protein [Sulfurisphaera ohwakuensis]|uniref:Uncharacterized protein n=1 Tax=Sulfurisphaera ohwakuensis TaxID=69656 RepID=A0A650CJN0_SULOH|nr:hypothetical protein [Sulfurisphaera ohwakuensis]MBB5254724.1 hypothetical protein [Sulfurisphaera ohwakuensis]QGR18074.1 hypothetical protein D1869_13410 [Sulfurisphaera ohwakuensis]
MIVFKDVQWIDNDKFRLLIHGIEVMYKVEIKPGTLTKIILHCLNYDSICILEIDTSKNKLVAIQCIGFEKDEVKKAIVSKLAVQVPQSLRI